MSKRALIDHRPWLLASLAAAISYFFVSDGNVPGVFLMIWKGLGAGLLSIYVWRRTRGTDGLLMAIALAFCCFADMVLEFSLLLGAGLFAIAHVMAIALYLRNRRESPTGSQMAAGVTLLAGVPLLTALVTYPAENWHLATAYALVLGAMAGAAWISAFPRYRVGSGAVLFVVSDLLIFAREAGRIDAGIADWLIWPLYYGGIFMIATGVVQTLRHEKVVP